MTGNTKGDAFSYRPTTEHERLLNELVDATKHKKARFLDMALEKILPDLEKRYAPELDELRKKRAELNDAASSTQTKPPGLAVSVEAVKYTNAPRKRAGQTKTSRK